MPSHTEDKMQADAKGMPRDMGMATQTLMGADPDIQTVLVSRLSQMSPEELKTLDQAITPQVRGALMKLLPELSELIDMIDKQGMGTKPEEKMDNTGMPKEMGALGAM